METKTLTGNDRLTDIGEMIRALESHVCRSPENESVHDILLLMHHELCYLRSQVRPKFGT